MWNIHHKITSIAIRNEKPLNRWLTSIVILLSKDVGRPKIHRLRLINTYESEDNLILKYFWPKKGIHKAEDNNWLGKNETEGMKKHECSRNCNNRNHDRYSPINQSSSLHPPRRR